MTNFLEGAPSVACAVRRTECTGALMSLKKGAHSQEQLLSIFVIHTCSGTPTVWSVCSLFPVPIFLEGRAPGSQVRESAHVQAVLSQRS